MRNIILLLLIVFSLPSILIAQPTIIGACSYGSNQFGTILSYTVGDITVDKVYKFKGVEGAKPQQTNFISTGGKLYGMASEGGAYNYGVIFEYNPITNVYAKKFDFNESVGATPSESLMLESNGKMYGMTKYSGFNFLGVIFEYDYI
ncbi:MAG: hypothetical protein IPP71_17685 [Bacteroidetes bacterium]|nr:hypothetical protein [Bacteroidota bacterium]